MKNSSPTEKNRSRILPKYEGSKIPKSTIMSTTIQKARPSDAFGKMVRNILESRFESFDEETVKHAKLRILDVIGCMIAGYDGPMCSDMLDLIREWGGDRKDGQSTIALDGVKTSAQDAAMANTLMCRSYDYEPVQTVVHGKSIPSHISGTTIPTALAVGEWKRVSGRDMITAVIVGDDFSSRVLGASGFSFDEGWDNTGTINVFGATGTAGKLMHLDETKMRNALGIALNQLGGSFQSVHDGSLCFKLPSALAARSGIFSAELAAKGYTAAKDPLMSQYGYFRLCCSSYDPDVLTLGLGKEYFYDRTFKPYPACRATHGAIECALTIVDQRDIDVKDISEITIGVSERLGRSFISEPFSVDEAYQSRASLNLRYVVANVLVRKSIRLEHFTDPYVQDSKVGNLARTIEIEGKMPPEKLLAADLEVIFKNGGRLYARVDVPKGDGIVSPLSKQELEDKFMRNVAFCGRMPEAKAARLIDMIDALEDLDNIADLMEEMNCSNTRPLRSFKQGQATMRQSSA